MNVIYISCRLWAIYIWYFDSSTKHKLKLRGFQHIWFILNNYLALRLVDSFLQNCQLSHTRQWGAFNLSNFDETVGVEQIQYKM